MEQSLRTILHRSTMALGELNQMSMSPQLGILRVAFGTIQALAIDELRKIDKCSDEEDLSKTYRR